jgi:hypothetical protein
MVDLVRNIACVAKEKDVGSKPSPEYPPGVRLLIVNHRMEICNFN